MHEPRTERRWLRQCRDPGLDDRAALNADAANRGTAADPNSVLAIVTTRDRWHHRVWIDDGRKPNIQAADVFRHILAGIERDHRVLAEQHRQLEVQRAAAIQAPLPDFL